jgi:long-chain fatty acid transport protein
MQSTRAICGAAAVLLLAICAPRAAASGFGTARFGGEHSTAADGTPASIYYNPAGISLLDGQHLMLDATIALRSASYVRSPEAIDRSTLDAVDEAGLDRDGARAALSGESTLDDVVLLPFVGVVSDLGMPSSPVRVGAAFFVPFGGQSSWDELAANEEFPGAQDGSARWYNVEGTIRSMTGALAVAYRLEDARLSFGVAGNLYFSEVNTLRARNANGTDNLVSGDGRLLEGRSWLDVSGVHFGFGAGLLWEAVQERLWLGASYQSQPALGTMELTGTLRNTLGSAQPGAPSDVVFTQELPDIVRIGVRGRVVREVELRASAEWMAWSRLSQMCLVNEAVGDIDAACETRSDGGLVHREHAGDVIQVFQRRWVDGFGARLGASYFASDQLELYGGAGFDSNAVPSSTLDPALFDMAKYSFSLGATYRMTESLAISLTVMEVLYLDRDTRGVAGNESFELPSRQPANAGVYEQNVFLIQPAVQLSL